MKDENTWGATGRITRDLEFSKTKEGRTQVKIGFALHVDDNITYFFNLCGYGDLADFTKNNFKKGDPISIRAYVRHRRYTDETSKKVNNYVDAVLQRIQLLGTYKNKFKH